MLRAVWLGGGQPRPKPLKKEKREGEVEANRSLRPTPPFPHAGLGRSPLALFGWALNFIAS